MHRPEPRRGGHRADTATAAEVQAEARRAVPVAVARGREVGAPAARRTLAVRAPREARRQLPRARPHELERGSTANDRVLGQGNGDLEMMNAQSESDAASREGGTTRVLAATHFATLLLVGVGNWR